jgi:hypothetical protein
LHCLQKMRPLAQQGLTPAAPQNATRTDKQPHGRWATGRPKRARTSLLYYRNIAVYAEQSTGQAKRGIAMPPQPHGQTAVLKLHSQPRVRHPGLQHALQQQYQAGRNTSQRVQKYSWPQHYPSSTTAKTHRTSSTCKHVLQSAGIWWQPGIHPVKTSPRHSRCVAQQNPSATCPYAVLLAPQKHNSTSLTKPSQHQPQTAGSKPWHALSVSLCTHPAP